MNNSDCNIYNEAIDKIKKDKKCKRKFSTSVIDLNSGLTAYGGKYNNNTQLINIVIGSQTQIPLPSNMPNLNTTYSDNSIIINQTGIYEINYFINTSIEVAALLTLAVRVNGVNIPSTVISRLVEVDVGTIYSGSTIIALNKGDTIDVALSALIDVNVTLGTGTGATLTVKKIN